MKKFAIMAAIVCAMLAGSVQAQGPQEEQGKYVNSSAARLVKMIDKSNKDGYKLWDNQFSCGGIWLKQGSEWTSLVTVTLTKGKEYRFLCSGDMDAQDVDLRIIATGSKAQVASDTSTAPEATISFTPSETQQYTIQVRNYRSKGGEPSFCLAMILAK